MPGDSQSSTVMRVLVVVLTIAAVLQVALLITSEDTAKRPSATLRPLVFGDTLPDITLYAVGGSRWVPFSRPKTQLTSLFSRCGLLVFFSSSCPACERAAPSWEGRDSLEVADARVPVFWIGRGDDREASSWVERHGFKNSYEVRPDAWRELGVEFVPQMYIVDNDGAFIADEIGKPEYVERFSQEDLEWIRVRCQSQDQDAVPAG